MSKTEKRARGDRGENAAVGYLCRRFYRILSRNYRAGSAEIDVVAKRGKTLVFVEVKLRKNADFAAAREFVTRAKQQRILATASLYLAQHETQLQPRFDVIEIYAPLGERGRLTVNHIEDAFET